MTEHRKIDGIGTACNPILFHLDRGTLMRREMVPASNPYWRDQPDWGDGIERATLYTALVPGATTTRRCPENVMPQWLADVTQTFNFNIPIDRWADSMRRFGEAAAQWMIIPPMGWRRIRIEWMVAIGEVALAGARRVNFDRDPHMIALAAAVRTSAVAHRAQRDLTPAEKAQIKAARTAVMQAERAAEAAENAACRTSAALRKSGADHFTLAKAASRARRLAAGPMAAKAAGEAASVAEFMGTHGIGWLAGTAAEAWSKAAESDWLEWDEAALVYSVSNYLTLIDARERGRSEAWAEMFDRLLDLIEAEIARAPLYDGRRIE